MILYTGLQSEWPKATLKTAGEFSTRLGLRVSIAAEAVRRSLGGKG